jgi:glycosyltransferase involved in cell wall biosynthesis
VKTSIIIPCRNAEAFLGIAIRSLLNQTRPPDEIIVADNGSEDGSRRIAQSFGAPVRLIEVPERGASRARLAGLAEAEGEALMFCDADDLVAPETLAALVEALEAGEGDIACAPWYRFEQGPGGAWHWAPPSCAPRYVGQDDLSAWLGGWYHPPCSVLWSRAAYDRSGGWDPEIAVNQDGDVMMRGLARGNVLARTADGAAFYRRLPGGGSLSGTARSERGLAARLEVNARIIELLEQSGRLPLYRSALAGSLDRIACDIPPEAEVLRTRCAGLALRLGDAPDPVQSRPGWPTGSGPPGPDPKTPPVAARNPRGPDLRVSVVIPAYNRANTIARAVASALAQDPPPFEVIVVDDGSTDATREVVEAIADPRLRLVSQPNAGASAARNRGIAEARGGLIAFLDSDDEWLPGKLAAQVARFRAASPRLGLVYTGFESIAADGSRTVHRARARGWIYRDLLARNVVTGCGSTAMMTRAALELAGGFDPTLAANEDYDLVLRIARFFEADCVPDPLARYHDGEITEARVSRQAAANRDTRRVLFARYGEDMRRAGTAHLFFIASAERELFLSGGTIPVAMRAAARAILSRPQRPFVWRWAATRFFPQLVRRTVANGVSRA